MTKLELLADLAGRPQIKTLLGELTDITPTGETPNFKWYSQDVCELINDAAIKRTITFYVGDEGEPTEWAAYKDAAPTADVQTNQFENWLNAVLYADSDAKAWRIVVRNELTWRALVAILEENGEGTLDAVGYLITRDGDGQAVKQKLNYTSTQLLPVLIAKL